MENNSEKSYGQRLVGYSFNPSMNPKVQRVKELCAELADIVNEENNKGAMDEIATLVAFSALQNIKDASMNAVKLITL
jgi:hypothetical protein